MGNLLTLERKIAIIGAVLFVFFWLLLLFLISYEAFPATMDLNVSVYLIAAYTGLLTKIMPEFTKRNTKVIALSCNPVDSHVQWQADIMKHAGSAEGAFPYPIVDDTTRELAVELGMVDPEEVSATGAPMTCRAVFIISPDKKVKLSILYPASCGRNFDEVLRALDSLQMTVKHKVATPVNWVKGSECMVVPSVKDADMAALFPLGVRVEAVPSGKGYLRFTPDPST